MIIITSLAVAGTAVFNEPIQNSITTKVLQLVAHLTVLTAILDILN